MEGSNSWLRSWAPFVGKNAIFFFLKEEDIIRFISQEGG